MVTFENIMKFTNNCTRGILFFREPPYMVHLSI